MKTKKLFIITLLLCSLIIPMVSGCGCDATHTHTFSDWVQTIEPTCTKDGEMRRECLDCDYYETTPINKLGHSYGEWRETVHPNCTEKGKRVRNCIRCNIPQEETLSELGHDFSKVWSYTDTHHYHSCLRTGCSAKSDEEEHKYSNGKTKCEVCDYDKGNNVFQYSKNKDGVSYSITGTSDTQATEIIIPDEYNNLPVTEIAEAAFYTTTPDESVLTKVTIGNNIKKIGKKSFGGNKNLQDIIFSDSVEEIGQEAFSGCESLSTLEMPESLRKVSQYAFYNCNGLTSVVFKDNLENLESFSFYNCSELERVDLGNGSLAAKWGAFYSCDKIKYVTIGENVKSFAGGVFTSEIIEFNNKNNVDYIGNNENQFVVAMKADETITNYSSEPGTRAIAGSAFEYCSQLETVNLGVSVTSIGDSAFSGCSTLTNLTLSPNLRNINEYAFYGCSAIQKVYIDSIENWLKIKFDVNVSDDQMQYQGDVNPLYNGEAELIVDSSNVVTTINMSDEITEISPFAFAGYNKLTSINIGKNVNKIGDFAFTECKGLETITIADGNTTFEASQNCVVKKDTKTLVVACKNSIIPDDVKIIPNCAFKGLGDIANNEINIPDSVETIGDYAFWGCNLDVVRIGNGIKSIGEMAFDPNESRTVYLKDIESWCNVDLLDGISSPICWGASIFINGTEVTGYGADYESNSLVIPETVETIKPWVFYNCIITDLEISAKTTKIDPTSFAYTANLGNVIVDAENPVYKMSSTNDGIIENGNVLFLCINKTNVDFSQDNIEKIGEYAFATRLMESVNLPTTVKEIGDYAFESCALTSFEIKNGVTKIGDYAFSENLSLTSITIASTVTEIGAYSFNGCSVLEEVKFGKENEVPQIERIGESAFWYDGALTTIKIPASVIYIGETAFGGTGLTSAIFEDPTGWIATDYEGTNDVDSAILMDESQAANELIDGYKTYTKN